MQTKQKNMKKVFHIVSNKEWGGGEQYVLDLCQRQMADGINVRIFCKPIKDIIHKYEEADIKVKSLNLGGMMDFRSAWGLAAAIKQEDVDVIHAHNFKDAFIACYARRISGAKHVHVVMCRHLTRIGKNSFPYRWLYRQLDCLCFDSELSKAVFRSSNPTIDEDKIRIVHTSIVVPEKVALAPVRKELSITNDTVLAMFHGRLDVEKGLDTLIEAVELLKGKNFKLALIGRGSDKYTAHLRLAITSKQLQDHVLLLGFRHPVLPYVAAADFGILPSIVREGCPLSPQEYMSQGLPVIATNNGGQREYIVSGHNGLLVTPANPQELAQAILKLIEQPELRQRLGRQAKADFDDHLNYEHFYAQIKRIY